MPTYAQLLRTRRPIRLKKNKTPALQNCPQKSGTCTKVFAVTPKKPNSAIRKIAKVWLSTKKKAICYIPGVGHNLQRFASVLVRGGRVKDIPGMRYHIVRGKFDSRGVWRRRQARSKYGVKLLIFKV